MNNEVHESVGGQATSAKYVDIPTLVKSNGYQNVLLSENKEKLMSQLGLLIEQAGPNFMEVIVKPGSRGDLGRPTVKPIDNKKAFMAFVNEK